MTNTNLRDLNQRQSQHPFWDFVNEADQGASAAVGQEQEQEPWGGQETNSQPTGNAPVDPPTEPTVEDTDPPVETSEDLPGHPHPHPHHHGDERHRRGGPRGRGRHGWGRGGPSGFPFGRGGASGPFGRGGFRDIPGVGGNGAPFDFPALASWVQSNFIDPHVRPRGCGNGDETTNTPFGQNQSQDFVPAIDIFSTKETYVVHVSLPGVVKEDIGVNWESEGSTLIVSGVIHRPGDEELLKAIEVSERQVGAFERKVVLGTKAEPARIQEEGISAKLVEGVLRITVPKVQKEAGQSEVRKVAVE